MRSLALLTMILLFVSNGCDSSSSQLQEPKGKPVVLEGVDFGKSEEKSAKMWRKWHVKGVRLVKEERYEEALYCFNKAIEAWPEKVKKIDPRITHLPEATTTFLKKGDLFLKMKKPRLAIVYYEKFEKYFPGDKFAEEGKKLANEMLSQ